MISVKDFLVYQYKLFVLRSAACKGLAFLLHHPGYSACQ